MHSKLRYASGQFCKRLTCASNQSQGVYIAGLLPNSMIERVRNVCNSSTMQCRTFGLKAQSCMCVQVLRQLQLCCAPLSPTVSAVQQTAESSWTGVLAAFSKLVKHSQMSPLAATATPQGVLSLMGPLPAVPTVPITRLTVLPVSLRITCNHEHASSTKCAPGDLADLSQV